MCFFFNCSIEISLNTQYFGISVLQFIGYTFISKFNIFFYYFNNKKFRIKVILIVYAWINGFCLWKTLCKIFFIFI